MTAGESGTDGALAGRPRRWRGVVALLGVYGPAFAVAAIGFVIAYQFVEPAPPDSFTIATGPASGAYHRFAMRYGEILARYGIRVEVRETAGTIENLDLLARPGGEVSVAFVQGGVAGSRRIEESAGALLSLASLYHEPVWLFHRGEEDVDRIPQLAGRRVAIGARGSGTRALVERLIADNGLAGSGIEAVAIGGEEARRALLDGKIDAAFFIASARSRLIETLLETSGIRVASFRRAEAYARRYRFLSRVTLPEGIIDLHAGIPPAPVSLIAPAATLVIRSSFHPALVDLLLQAAAEAHGPGGIFERAGEFPSPDRIDFPLSPDARRYFTYGPPLLQKYLPFWAATLIDRLKVMLLPLVVLLIPLVKILPPTYRWRVRSKIYRWYRELQEIDRRLHEDGARGSIDVEEVSARIDRIERDVVRVTVPLSYGVELYDLRVHIELVRDTLRSAAGRRSS